MAQRNRDGSFRALIERFAQDLSVAIGEFVQVQVRDAVARASAGRMEADGRRSGRLCPVPGCGEPGAGPRNRWFCRDHARKLSAAEQKSIVERNKRLAAEGKLPTAVPSQRIVRLPPKSPRPRRTLDMSCRGVPVAEPEVRHETPVIAAVPPIVRKAEPAAESS